MLKRTALAAALVMIALPALAQQYGQQYGQQSGSPPPSSAPQGYAQQPAYAPGPNGQQQMSRPAIPPQIRAAFQSMRQACEPDVATFCSGVAPAGGGIMKCLRAQGPNLSAPCKGAWQNLRAVRQASRGPMQQPQYQGGPNQPPPGQPPEM